MGERNAAPQGRGPAAKKQAEGVRTGNEKLQDRGQRVEDVKTDRKDGTFAGGKDRMGGGPQGAASGSKEGHVVETGAPADILDEDRVTDESKDEAAGKKGGLQQ